MHHPSQKGISPNFVYASFMSAREGLLVAMNTTSHAAAFLALSGIMPHRIYVHLLAIEIRHLPLVSPSRGTVTIQVLKSILLLLLLLQK